MEYLAGIILKTNKLPKSTSITIGEKVNKVVEINNLFPSADVWTLIAVVSGLYFRTFFTWSAKLFWSAFEYAHHLNSENTFEKKTLMPKE